MPDEHVDPGYLLPTFLEWMSIETDSFVIQDTIISEASSVDDYKHIKYNQYHKGYKVEGAEIIEHIKGDYVTSMNGKFAYPWGSMLDEPIIDYETAVENAINDELINGNYIPLWLDSTEEANFQLEMNDSLATYYPQPTIVWALPSIDSVGYQINGYDFDLCIKVPCPVKNVSDSTSLTFIYYINAYDGNVVRVDQSLREFSGTAVVRHYSGNQTINVKHRGWPNNDYILKDEVRNLHTKDYGGTLTLWGLKGNITDDDGNWGTDDQFATSAHFFVSLAWDYFDKTFYRQGWNDNYRSIKIRAHHKAARTVTDIIAGEIIFGNDRDGNYVGSLDVAGHEFAHGVIGATSDLTGVGQPGTVNEGVSDIFGFMVEKYFENAISDWKFNEDNAVIRRIDDPSLLGRPNALYDNNWCQISPCSPDVDFMHWNCTFIGHWFYLSSVGKSWWSGIGTDKAALITYLAVTEHLTSTSGWHDFRDATLAVVKDEYGECSNEHITLLRAWKEVNLESTQYCAALSAESIMNYENQIILFPNPTRNFIQLKCELPNTEYRIEIYNTLGGKTESRLINGMGLNMIDISNYSSGVYFIEIFDISNNSKIWNSKIIKN